MGSNLDATVKSALILGSRAELSERAHYAEVIEALESRGCHLMFSGLDIKPSNQDQQSAEIDPEPESFRRIVLWDQWARKTWHSRTAHFSKRVMALVVWASVRIYYKLSYLLSSSLWIMASLCRYVVQAAYWRGIHPFALEPTARLWGRVRWKTYDLVSFNSIASTWGPRWALVSPSRRLHNWVQQTYRRIRPPSGDDVGPLSAPQTGNRDVEQERQASVGNRSSVERSDWGPQPLAKGPLAQCLQQLIDGGTPPSVVLIPDADCKALEELLLLVPALGLDEPLDVTLVACLTRHATQMGAKNEAIGSSIAQRLASGSPFRLIVLVAADGIEVANGEWRGLPVNRLPETVLKSGPSAAEPSFADGLTALMEDCLSGPPKSHVVALEVGRFGPLAILASALWGRVGSSTIFDGQARVMINEGYRLARVYIDHWPTYGAERTERIEEMVNEDQENVRPHYDLVLERDISTKTRRMVFRSNEFRKGSPVLRTGLLLASTVTSHAGLQHWLKANADVAIVNHVSHLRAVEALTDAPVILETHDITSKLLDVHGIPGFVPRGPDSIELRLEEERAEWRRVACCVNLSPEDEREIAPYARFSEFIRPFRPQSSPSKRSWLEVCAANPFQGPAQEMGAFDLLLWGSWHENNAESIRWFFDEVRPKLTDPEKVRVVVVGRVLNEIGRFIDKQPSVSSCKFVDRLEDIASRTLVVVIPDRGGTGICVKAMDAFSWGAAFVSTRHGLRGLDWERSMITPTDSADDMAADIDLLLSSPSARRARQAASRHLYARNFSLEAYEIAWRRVLSNTSQAAQASATSVRTQQYPASMTDPTAGSGMTTDNGKRPGAHSNRAQIEATKVPELSVVVATYQRYGVLPDTLASLLEQNVPTGFLEIIVVDNSPDQMAAAEFGSRYDDEPTVQYILEPIAGLSNARNVGAQAARAEVVAFIDDDAIADPEWAKELVSPFNDYDGRAGVVGGRVLPRWVKPKPDWLADDLVSYLSIIDWRMKRGPLPKSKWVAGCNIAFAKAALFNAGGFSSSLGRKGSGLSLLSSEETDVTAKINENGLLTIYAPEAVVEHVIDPDRLTRQWFRRRSAWQAVSDFIKDPEKTQSYAPAASEHLRTSLNHRLTGSPLGLYGATDDARAFQQEVGLAYDIVVSTLAGGLEVDPTGAPSRPIRLKDRIKGRVRAVASASPMARRLVRAVRRIVRV